MNQNKKIAVNSGIIFVRLCVVSVVSLISARFVLQALGASDYGLYNVVGGMVNLLNIFNAAMITTTYRYLTYELGRSGNLNKVFNTSFTIHLFLAIIIAVLCLSIGLWYVNSHLNIASEKLSDARFVLCVSTFTAVITTLLVPFQGLLTAYEKFNVSAVIDIITQFLKLGLIISLLYIPVNKIRVYSLIMLVYYLLYALLFCSYGYLKYRDTVRLNRYRDKSLYREMVGFTGWILCGAGANVGQVQGTAMIINYFFGTIANAAFAVANQVHNFVTMFAGNLGQAAVPQITKSFSGGNSDRSVNLACYISKYTCLLMAIVAFPLIIDIDFILGVWLKEVPEDAGIMCNLTLLNGLLCCLGAGTPALIQATGKIKTFQIVLSTMSLSGLPLAIIIYKLGCPVQSILVICCIVSSLIAIVRLILLKRVLNFDIRKFLSISYAKILYVSVPLTFFYFYYNPDGFSTYEHIWGLVGSEAFLFIMIALLGLDSKERLLLRNTLKLWKTKIRVNRRR